jgi:hypothetical protein
MKRRLPTLLIPLLLAALLPACSDPPSAENNPAAIDYDALRSRIAVLQDQVGRVRGANDIKRLQRSFGYYMEEALWDEVVDLFAEDATLEMARDGVYRGRERIRQYLYALGRGQQGLRAGQLNETLQLMPVVTLGDDGLTARARWRAILLTGEFGQQALWGEGPYENEYVKEEGVWKISSLHWHQSILVPYAGGWARHEDFNQGIWVSDELPPDAPPTDDQGYWPKTFLPPFSFANPVGTYVPVTTEDAP